MRELKKNDFEQQINPSAEAAQTSTEVADMSVPPTYSKDKYSKTSSDKSKLLTALAIILHILSFAAIVAMTIVLAIKCYTLVPYYSFWPFVGVILAGVFALIFMVIVLVITRKKSKKSIRRQTTGIVVGFFCLTVVFGVLMQYVFPDVISMATQGTLYCEDLYNNGSKQAETNAELERQFIMYNLINGNYDPKLSYYDLTEFTDEDKTTYKNAQIETQYEKYCQMSNVEFESMMLNLSSSKRELFNFVYNSYVMLDYNYAFKLSSNTKAPAQERRSLALAIVDHDYKVFVDLCKEGFSNQRIKYLFDTNFRSMDQDGYVTFDDPLLLYAQMEGRMTVPIIVRLILDKKYTYTTPILDENGEITGYDGYLMDRYIPGARQAYEDKCAEDGKEPYNVNGIGIDDEGRIIHRGVDTVQMPMIWCVLDMDGNPMAVAEGIDLSGLSFEINGANVSIGELLVNLLGGPLADLTEAVGDLLDNGLTNVIKIAANGAQLKLKLYLDDYGGLGIQVMPSNVEYGVLGYKQMSWVQSDNLLYAVINVMSLKNWLLIFGAVGLVLIIGAGLCREYALKAREDEKKAMEDAEAEREKERANAKTGGVGTEASEAVPFAETAVSSVSSESTAVGETSNAGVAL